jgi:Domain of unknown function (DUF397)
MGNAHDVTATPWRKSSYSGDTGGQCIEVSAADSVVAVRDSKDPDGPALAFTHEAHAAFIKGVKVGEFSSN